MSSDPTLIRGADGALYYLPPGELDSYRLPEDTAAEVVSRLSALADEAGAEVSGFDVRRLSSRQLSPRALGLPGSASIPGSADLMIEVVGELEPTHPDIFR